MKHLLRILLAVSVFTVLPPTNTLADELAEQKALQSAKTWLSLVDRGEYQKSWSEAASFVKRTVSQSGWVDSIRAARTPLGTLRAREVVSKTYTRELPGAPDGEYVVIQFRANFARKSSGIETVTPMRDTDGVWRVSGYYIR